MVSNPAYLKVPRRQALCPLITRLYNLLPDLSAVDNKATIGGWSWKRGLVGMKKTRRRIKIRRGRMKKRRRGR